jgi:glyoxylase-like metal-dependent hydrolase (beta-lactamase superfamily II)
MDGRSLSLRGRLACHCLLIETNAGLVLADTGFGLRDVADPPGRLSRFFLTLLRPEFRAEMTASRQIERLGFSPRDVRHIVLTHLDFDHAGGLDDFPDARVHLLTRERNTALAQRTWMDRQRYRPQQWSTRANWQVYRTGEGDPWFGFSCVRELRGVSADVLLVPLVGHTHGHAGIAVDTGTKWLFLAGDAYFDHREMNAERPRCTAGLRLYQWMLEKDGPARRWNQQRLRELRAHHGAEIEIFSGHDPREFERLAGRPLHVPMAAISPARSVGVTAAHL